MKMDGDETSKVARNLTGSIHSRRRYRRELGLCGVHVAHHRS
jgi:hypothetical protein